VQEKIDASFYLILISRMIYFQIGLIHSINQSTINHLFFLLRKAVVREVERFLSRALFIVIAEEE
jgi:hypothetical protein